jgi:hypothetical protein
MAAFDYNAPAELFPSKGRGRSRSPVSYRRFDTAAEAVRFAIEELPPAFLSGAVLEVSEARFDMNEIRALYDAEKYPLPREQAKKIAG